MHKKSIVSSCGLLMILLLIQSNLALGQQVIADEEERVRGGIGKTLVNDIESPAEPQAEPKVRTAAEMAVLYEKFERLLTGAKMRGQFTIDGRPLTNLSEEVYEIQAVTKQPEGDMWVIKARIKYGDHDFVAPVPLEVKWAGNTPVMTLDNLTIPGFGTFGARVVFHKDKYAGTWQHDQVGGHMFGTVELAGQAKKSDE